MTLVLSSFDVGQINGVWDAPSTARGEVYFAEGRVGLTQITAVDATLEVLGSQGITYNVDVWIQNGKTHLDCNCPVARDFIVTLCKHKVAAILYLRDHFDEETSKQWERALSLVITERPLREVPQQFVLCFVLQLRPHNRISPFIFDSPQLGDTPLDTAEAICDAALSSARAGALPRPLRKVDFPKLAKVKESWRSLAETILFANNAGDRMWGTKYIEMSSVLPLLRNAPLLLSRNGQGLFSKLLIAESSAAAVVTIETSSTGLSVVPSLHIPNSDIELDNAYEVLARDRNAAWVISGNSVVRVEGTTEVFEDWLESGPIEVPTEDIPNFLDQYVEDLANQFLVEAPDLITDIDCSPIPCLYLDEIDQSLVVSLRFDYGGIVIAPQKSPPAVTLRPDPEDAKLIRIARKHELEASAFEILRQQPLRRGEQTGEFRLKARSSAIDFVVHSIPQLAEFGFHVYGTEDLKSVQINRGQAALSVSIESGQDWFDLKTDASFGGVSVPTANLLHALRHSEKYVKLIDGSIGQLPEEWIARFKRIGDFGQVTSEGFKLRDFHAVLAEDLEGDTVSVYFGEDFREKLRNLAVNSDIPKFEVPAPLQETLREYQKAGYDWLHFLRIRGFGGILADDMGLGKTLQVLAYFLSLKPKHIRPHLIILPRSLMFNWLRESAHFTPTLSVKTYDGVNRVRNKSSFAGADVILTTYGIALRDFDLIRDIPFDTIVLDEAQAIKNPGSQIARAVRTLTAEHRITVTGTPIENSVSELWSQFAFLNPGLLGSFEAFREKFATPIERRQDAEAASTLRRLVFPFIMRRTKEQAASELPPRTERIVFAHLSGQQRKLYDETRDHYRSELLQLIGKEGMQRSRIKVIEALLRLRQIANHPRLFIPGAPPGSGKIELLKDLIATVKSEGNKCLVFSQFVKMLTIIRGEFDSMEIPYSYLDGSTREREAEVDAFQNDPNIRFFLISLKAGGVGLNLTEADYVIHVDPWWNPAVEQQASDRAHRIGQDKPVFIYKLIAKDTVEEKILQLQERKRTITNQVITNESGFFKNITVDDVQELLA